MPVEARGAAVIPARNEERTIREVVRGIAAHVEHVIVVDDASTDRTASIAARAGAEVMRHSGPRAGGYSATILLGCARALELGVGHIVTLDADGAHDPADAPALISAHCGSSAALTVGNRFSSNDPFLPSSKRTANLLASFLINSVAGTTLSDVACGYRVYHPAFLKFALRTISPNGFSLPYQTVICAHVNGCVIHSHPVAVRYDVSSELYTRTNELMDLLRCVTEASSSDLHRNIFDGVAEMRKLVETGSPFAISFQTEMVFAHPTKDGYRFERQHPDLRSVSTSPAIRM